VKISFTKDGKLIDATLLSDIHEENIAIDSNYTKTKGTEQTGVQKFVKNIGRFNKTADGKKKKQKKQGQ
jgi:outer membrane protein assembly factor BamE (lipoprotein component of BamABCDE complex)